MAGLDEHVAARELAPLDRREVHGDPLARLGALDGRVVHLHASAHAHLGRPARRAACRQTRSFPTRACRSRSCRSRGSVKARSTYSRVASSLERSVTGDARERGAQLVEAGAGLRRHHDDLGARCELVRLVEGELERLLVDRVRLRDGDDAVLDAEQAQHREVLVRLRARTFLRVDHEQEEVDAGRAGDHRAHEPLVPGHVDEREAAAVGQLERRVAEVDRDPARLLLGQPVGVLAGERAHEPGLAVVDVAGGADGQRHARTDGRRLRRPPSSPSVRQSSRRRPSRTIPTTGGSCPRSPFRKRLLDRAGERRQLGERERSAADATDRLLDLAADGGGEPLGAVAHGARHPRAACAAPVPRAAHAGARGRGAASLRARPG